MTDTTDLNADSADDRALRERLAQSAPETSAEHDSAVLAAARAFTDQDRADEPPLRRTPRWPVAVAAVLTLGVGTALVLPALQSAEPVLRGGVEGVEPAPEASLTTPPAQFSLPERFAGLSCQLTLRDAEGSTLWQSATFDGAIAVPDEIKPALREGHFQWAGRCVGRGEARFGPWVFTVSR